MATAEDAAFRILEISAILLPLLFIVVQVFIRHLTENEESPLTGAGGLIRFFVYAAMFLVVAVGVSSSVLILSTESRTLTVAIVALYLAFTLVAFPMAMMGVEISNELERRKEQIDLQSSLEEVVTKSEDREVELDEN